MHFEITKNYSLAVFGLILVIFSYILAIKKFHYFYTILVVGNFLVYNSLYYLLNKKYLLKLSSWLKFYVALIPGGIIADMFMGRILSSLHYYPFYGPINYLIIYLIIYPLGGLILVYCYSLIKNLFKNYKEKKISLNSTKNILIVGLFVSLFLIPITLIYKESLPSFGFWIFTWITFAILFLMNLTNLFISKNCLIKEITSLNRPAILSILFTMFFNGFLHELPNTFAWEWVYCKNCFPVNTAILQIPLWVITLGWLGMTIILVSYFQLLKNVKYINEI
ncbi:MAG: hypothetical protein Q7R99_03950 [bacterium]|nr:hypothetical protein [bacterium]